MQRFVDLTPFFRSLIGEALVYEGHYFVELLVGVCAARDLLHQGGGGAPGRKSAVAPEVAGREKQEQMVRGSVQHRPVMISLRYIPRIIICSLPDFGLHLSVIHYGILHLSHPGLDVVEGQVRDRLLEAVEIHDG